MPLLRPRNLLLLLALVLAGVLAAIVTVRYRPEPDVAQIVKSLPTGIDVALQHINYTHSEGGVARWKLVADQVEQRSTDRSTSAKDLQLTFFADDGTEQGTLTARQGEVDADYAVVKVQDDVKIVNRNGYTLQTDHLIYRQADRSIRTDAPVKLTNDRLQLDGVGLHLDLASRHLIVLSRVRAVLQPKR